MFVRKFGRDPSLRLVAQDDSASLAIGGGLGDFVIGRKLLMPMTFARKNASQQELGEMAEGGGFLARNAPEREQAKNLGERAVHAGGGGEVAAGGIEFGKVECGADDTGVPRFAEQLFFPFGVVAAERGMNFGTGHTTLATVGESELAAVWQRLGRDPSLRFAARDADPDRIGELAARGQDVSV
jgi:hypothetical protein